MLHTSKEKMATYIGTKYGDNSAQEWTSEKRVVLPEPTYSKAILDRHAERVQATRDLLEECNPIVLVFILISKNLFY